MPDNAILRDLRAARRAAGFTGADRWALDTVTLRRGLRPEHCRLLAWAHLKSRRGQTFHQSRVQREARAREAHTRDWRHLPDGDAA